MKAWVLCLMAMCLSACIPYPGALPDDYGGRTTIVSGVFPALDIGASQLQSLHFMVRAYGSQKTQQFADAAEASYSRIMADTGLYSFKPAGLYQLVVYANAKEFHDKTSQPSWSVGVAVGNAIYSFEGPHLEQVIAHEMTHLIFYEYMGRVNMDHRWINEGLAVYEEGKALQAQSQGASALIMRPINFEPLTLEQLTRLVPVTEREYTVNNWYAQAGHMVRFMVERGGRIGFSQFLEAIRRDAKLDDAIAAGFPGIWSNAANFEQAWRRSL